MATIYTRVYTRMNPLEPKLDKLRPCPNCGIQLKRDSETDFLFCSNLNCKILYL